MTWRVATGDCREVMAAMDPESVDAIVTDPPYGLEFMGKDWDRVGLMRSAQHWHEAWAREAFRVLRPGGHLLAFSGTRTYHRMACGIEDAGFVVRDMQAWLYGSGFPKSMDVAKALDAMAGATREVVGISPHTSAPGGNHGNGRYVPDEPRHLTAPATDLAREWDGWGTALKPAHEPVCVARRPLRGTVAANVARYGTGALNIDGCRIATGDDLNGGAYAGGARPTTFFDGLRRNEPEDFQQPLGRWPANVILGCACDDDGEHDPGCAVAMLDAQSGERTSGVGAIRQQAPGLFGLGGDGQANVEYGDAGGASRFFYTAKASRSEREAGLEALEPIRRSDGRQTELQNPRLRTDARRNHHPTVKPVDLMQWLTRLVTPPGGLVLDPFLGSGSTGIAALREGFAFLGIEQDAGYAELARHRIRGDAPLFNIPAEDAAPSLSYRISSVTVTPPQEELR